ncbi:MAG: penicillin acylase family protein [Mameliella sp.]|nr:penicillin acylase family protein [Phaeodactylibacter sp.]
MRYYALLFWLCISSIGLIAQIAVDDIQIARDQWGVPHIFAPTDEGVAYGLAWATAEDDFLTLQKQLLPAKGLMGEVFGKQGAQLDVIVHLLGARTITQHLYESDLSPEFRKILEAYADGLNQFAQKHPGEVLHKKLFPITGKDLIPSYTLGLALLSKIDQPLGATFSGRIGSKEPQERGSNAAAIAPHKTTTGETFLLANSHQPLEGLYSWYEAHVCSEEGWNMLGATFPGGATLFLGTNPHLGWAHTVNYPDFTDVYRLEMHPEQALTYRFDGQWLQLEPDFYKARIRLFGILPIGKNQKFYQSKYGITFKTPNGFFALRTTANQTIKAAEQWYRMNKASNWAEFREALDLQGITCTNIVYADKEGHIFHLGNGLLPRRDPAYDWDGILPGDTSATLWSADFYPVDSLVQVLDPPSGYVYNCNHSPFLNSGASDNPQTTSFPAAMGYKQPVDLTNRGARFQSLIQDYDKLSYDDFKRIKYDQAYQRPMAAVPWFEPIFHLNAADYPDIETQIALLQDWDRVADQNSEAAASCIMAYYHIEKQLIAQNTDFADVTLTNDQLAEALRHAQAHFRKHFGQATVQLGQLQQHKRGDMKVPIGGGPDVLAAVRSQLQPDGTLRPVSGDSYIQFVRFGPKGVQIESINAYGVSARPESPHYTDQMAPFSRQELKPMTLDKAEVLKHAKRVYHPD